MFHPLSTLVNVTVLLVMPPAHARQHATGVCLSSARNTFITSSNEPYDELRYFLEKTSSCSGVLPGEALEPTGTRKACSRVFVPPQSPDMMSVVPPAAAAAGGCSSCWSTNTKPVVAAAAAAAARGMWAPASALALRAAHRNMYMYVHSRA